MGNAPLQSLQRAIPEAAADYIPDLKRDQVRWTVYALRHHGVKLTPAQILATAKTGRLSLHRRLDAPPTARLCDNRGFTLRDLDDVTVQRMADGGMLLYGEEWAIIERGRVDYPQAWWCVVAPPGAQCDCAAPAFYAEPQNKKTP